LSARCFLLNLSRDADDAKDGRVVGWSAVFGALAKHAFKCIQLVRLDDDAQIIRDARNRN